MEEVKKKSKFKILLRKILRFFKRLFGSFMRLKPYVRYIIYVWTVILLLFIIFIIVSNNNNKFLDKYHTYEDNFKNISLKYVTDKSVYPTKERPIKLSLDMLKAYNYFSSSDIDDKSCVGYSMVYYDDVHADYNIKVYINCDKYTTEGYES